MTYSAEFFARRRTLALQSAERILDILWPIVSVQSVLDIGCASGIWLAEAKRRGAITIKGIDGPWVPLDQLEIDKEEFYAHDLGESIPAEFEKHDLAFCIEVAEHLPASASDALIEFLTCHADVVLFSAAIPGQGGTGHINEQCQSYWQHKFSKCGFACFDPIRPLVWEDESVNVIYKQNMLVYVREGSKSCDRIKHSKVVIEALTLAYDLDRVHPDLFKRRMMKYERLKQQSLGKTIMKSFKAIAKAAR
jgi:hypothetical protein